MYINWNDYSPFFRDLNTWYCFTDNKTNTSDSDYLARAFTVDTLTEALAKAKALAEARKKSDLQAKFDRIAKLEKELADLKDKVASPK